MNSNFKLAYRMYENNIIFSINEIEDIWFFSVRPNFISPNEHQKQYFHEWR